MIAGESSYITSCSPLPANSPTKLPTVDSAVISVLHVDDDKMQRVFMSKVLKAREVLVIISVNDGSKGLAAMQRYEFDLVISDLEMPTMDGLEMIAAFRGWEESVNDRSRRQRVVCLTGTNETRFSDKELMEAGFDKVLRKPVTREKINELLYI
jgi:CheY-like chemotaxis protein